MYGGGWWVYAWGSDQDKTKSVTWPLIKRVLSYARPYWTKIAITLVTILITTGLGLLTPLALMMTYGYARRIWAQYRAARIWPV